MKKNNQHKFDDIDTKEEVEKIPLQKLSLLSGLLWLIIGGLIIHFFQDRSIADSFLEGTDIWIQILTGTLFGLLFGGMGIQIVQHPGLQAAIDDYKIIKHIKKLSLSTWQILSVSIIAGITEEFLFRVAIQPIIGIWITSLIFIGVHGYIRLATVPQFLFTLFTFLLSMMLGYLYIAFGLYSAMIAHAVYDILVLWYISRKL